MALSWSNALHDVDYLRNRVPQQRTAAEGEDTRSSSATPRPWVGLTAEDMFEIDKELVLKCRLSGKAISDIDYAEAIEAKLKAKNERLEKNT